MANFDFNSLIIEGATAIWDLRADGDIQGTYTGTFRFRCFLTPTQMIAANREYREMLGPNPTAAPEHESFLAYALTQLKYRIITAPPFWTSSIQENAYAGDIPDTNVITEILNAAVNAEIKYRDHLKEKKLEGIKKAKEATEKLLRDQLELKEKQKDESESEEDSS